MGFPYQARYFLRWRQSDTGLTPSFKAAGCYFKRADTMASVPDANIPAIIEVGGGTYYFNWTFDTKEAPDIIFICDGGSSIPTEEVRYISDTLSAKDGFLDMPLSESNGAIWGDMASYSQGSKGWQLGLLGLPADDYFNDTVFGKIRRIGVLDVMGGTDAGQLSPGKNLLEVYNEVTSIAASVQDVVNTLVPPDNAGIAAIKAKTDQLPADTTGTLADIRDLIYRALGMLHENSVLDRTEYTATNDLRQGRMRTYRTREDAINAVAALPNDYSVNQIGEYLIKAEYEGTNLKTYTITREKPLP